MKKHFCVCGYCLAAIMSREPVSYRLAGADDVEADDSGLASCDWCGEKDDQVYVVNWEETE